jgi:hypothetical protein
MTVCRVVAHNERADLFRASPFTDTAARMVESTRYLTYLGRPFASR